MITIERKLEYQTAFDGIVKVYSLKSNKKELNQILKDKYFGDFAHNSENGIFLRLFENKKSWPKTILIHIDCKTCKISEIKKTDSSWNLWVARDLGNGKHLIEIQPTEIIEYEIDNK